MRISDWSSDVCSSDLACIESDWFWTTIKTGFIPPWEPTAEQQNLAVVRSVASVAAEMASGGYHVVVEGLVGPWLLPVGIGRASCRERVCQYVYISVFSVALKTTMRLLRHNVIV